MKYYNRDLFIQFIIANNNREIEYLTNNKYDINDKVYFIENGEIKFGIVKNILNFNENENDSKQILCYFIKNNNFKDILLFLYQKFTIKCKILKEKKYNQIEYQLFQSKQDAQLCLLLYQINDHLNKLLKFKG